MSKAKDIKITKQDFQIYESIRNSGETNMFDLGMVVQLADKKYHWIFDKDIIIEIMSNYNKLKAKYEE